LRRAEVERAEAAVRADAEKKRRRTQRALGAALLALLALVGAGGWYLDRHATERRRELEQQEAERRQAVTQALDAAEQRLRTESVSYGEVEAALTQAERRLGEDGPDELRKRLTSLRDDDFAMVRRLDRIMELQFVVVAGKYDPESAKREYPAAFRAYGLPVGASPAAELAERVRRSPIRRALLDGLELWLDEEPGNAALAKLLRLADADEKRNRIREALQRRDKTRLLDELRKVRAADAALLVDSSVLGPALAMRLGRAQLLYSEETLRQIEAAWWARPNSFPMAYRCGSLFLVQGRTLEAFNFYRAAVALRPDSAAAYQGMGSALEKRGTLDAAIACQRKAVELEPDFAAAYYALGKALMTKALAEKGQPEEALAAYRKAFARTPIYPAAFDEVAWTFKEAGRPLEAYQLFDKALTDHPACGKDPAATVAYNAACSAALAGCGQGREAPPEAERSKLRRRARELLRANLAVLGSHLDADPARHAHLVRVRMRQWQRDADLTGVRDKDALAKLPEAERKAWESLWADVAALEKRAWAK
jgi:tetratricopeptide (TPR) repeat protein